MRWSAAGPFPATPVTRERNLHRLLYVGSTATVGVLCWLGGTVVIMPKFSVSQAVQIIERNKPNFLLGVPTMMQRIAAEPALQQIDRSGLRALICGGAVIDRATVQRCTGAFSCSFINLYGSADGVNCHTLPDDDIEAILTTAGKPNPGVCEICIDDDGGDGIAAGRDWRGVSAWPPEPDVVCQRARSGCPLPHARGLGQNGRSGHDRCQGLPQKS